MNAFSDHREPSDVAGVDVGADRLHCVVIDASGDVVRSAVFGVQGDQMPSHAVAWLENTSCVAIDAPRELAGGHSHGSRRGKFALARCAELALGECFGIWVPWVTPAEQSLLRNWMKIGQLLFSVLDSTRVLEVFPYAIFRVWAASTLQAKGSVEGLAQRLALLQSHGIELPNDAEMWSHDGVDALAAAAVARDYRDGCAVAVRGDHDDSCIWVTIVCDATRGIYLLYSPGSLSHCAHDHQVRRGQGRSAQLRHAGRAASRVRSRIPVRPLSAG